MPEHTPQIEKALKAIEGELRVVCRGGCIVKIPAQVVEVQEKDGVIRVYKIPADIV